MSLVWKLGAKGFGVQLYLCLWFRNIWEICSGRWMRSLVVLALREKILWALL
jgi:hypothetical protein